MKSMTRRSFVGASAAGLLASAGFALVGCSNGSASGSGSGSGGSGSSSSKKTLNVGASPSPHAEILTKFAAPKLADKGIELKVTEYTDYILPNRDTTSGKVDANYFQHINYLNNYNEENKTDLVNVGKVHFEPMGVFAGKSSSLDALANGATIAIPNDPTNEGRALLLLQDKGLIKLKDTNALTATPQDIAENPKGLQFLEQEAAALPRTLNDADLSIINGNYAIAAGLKLEDAVAHEDPQSAVIQNEYANIVVTSADKKDDERIKALVEVLQTPELKDFLQANYGEAVLAAF